MMPRRFFFFFFFFVWLRRADIMPLLLFARGVSRRHFRHY